MRSPQGAVGAGTGMVCFDWKGGIGSSSRVTEDGHMVGVLVLANFGDAAELRIDGVPVGRLLVDAGLDRRRTEAARPRRPGAASRSSPPTRRSASAQLTRVARRAGLGLARTGSVAHNGSGEIFLAFSTTARAGARRAAARARLANPTSTRSSPRPSTQPRRRS